ncbi:ligand-binding sensor domain-containing protein [Thiocapsa bogorovii]|uniref:ABC transporter substrate-binding protein n=1 Tax=Thiocapsa bogorovii TaxID=521689 RepID=UPI001E3DDD85|nr:ABC transporter substrate-binding protein [Thiocapsa bogorovii]UHD15190.1 ABC transporter substrate-binding protein [Thiocapsa bogorovii]
MTFGRIAVAVPISIGLALIALGFLLPGDERLIRENLPLETHITALAPGADGTLLAATQAGELWRFDGIGWEQEDAGLDGRLVLALRGEPGEHAIGTATGLVSDLAPPPGNPRVSDVLETTSGLLVATPEGLWVHADDTWHHPLSEVPLYRLAEQRREGRIDLHAGAIGKGVYSASIQTLLSPWDANSRGLPDGVKALCFAVTEGGMLLVGTDRGLYRQATPGETWKALALFPPDRRVLALYRAPPDARGLQRLWIGTDEGLSALDLAETRDSVSVAGPLRSFDALWEPTETGVSWILPAADDALMVSAGAVYRLSAVRYPGWYRFVLAGILLLLVGGWLWLGLNPEAAPDDA